MRLHRRGNSPSSLKQPILGRCSVQLAHKLFDVTVEAADGKVPVWHKDVRFFALKAGGKPKAYFYLGIFRLRSRQANLHRSCDARSSCHPNCPHPAQPCVPRRSVKLPHKHELAAAVERRPLLAAG